MHTLKRLHTLFARGPAGIHELYHTVYRGNYRHAVQLLMLDLLLVLGAFAAVGAIIFFLLWTPRIQKFISIEMVVLQDAAAAGGPATGAQDGVPAYSGQAARVVFTITNNSTVKLTNATAQVEMPTGFTASESDGPFTKSDGPFLEAIPDLLPGASFSFSIFGALFVNPQDPPMVNAVLTYNQENNERVEQKNAIVPYTVVGGAFETSVETLPGIIVLDAPFDVSVTITPRQGLGAFDSAFIGIADNDIEIIDMTAEGAGAAAAPNERGWRIAGAGGAAPVRLRARLVLHDKSAAEALVGILSDPVVFAGGVSHIQGGTFDVAAARAYDHGISVVMGAAGAEAGAGPADAGGQSTIPVTIVNGPYPVTNMHIAFDVSGAREFSPAIESMEMLQPNESRTFSLNVAMDTDAGGRAAPLVISATADALVEAYGSRHAVSFDVPAYTAMRTAPPMLTGEALYFNKAGDQLGRGPLPPAVGSATSYWVHWRFDAGSKNISAFSIAAQLPAYVEPTGKVSVSDGPAPVFETATRTMRMSGVPLIAGTFVDVYFEVAVTPVAAHAGTVLRIAGAATARGTFEDGTSFTASGPILDTSLPADNQGRVAGTRVVK